MWPHNMAAMLAVMARSFSYEMRWLLLLIVMCDMTNGGVQGPLEGYNSLEEHVLSMSTTQYPPTTVGYVHPKWMEPYFDPSTPRNVTALMGKSAYLSCRVRNLGNKTVSWIRHRDIHILTVGAYTYTSDQRFQATHHQDTDDWTLQIKWSQKRDAGMYECQISTQPVRSYFVRLNVVVPTATILGGPDLHVDKGSTINLTCTVKFSPEPPAYIFWYHHEEVINYDSSRGGVSVITEKGDVTTSFLLIQNADLADSGKYSCAPSNADVASVRVHVLNGEHPEAMQTGSSGCQFSWLTIFLLVALVLCYQQQNLAMHATSAVVGVAINTKATDITTKSNVLPAAVAAEAAAPNSSELRNSDIIATTETKTAIDNRLLHAKRAINNAIALTTKTLTTISAVPNNTMACEAQATTTTEEAADIYVTLELKPKQKMLPGGTQRSKNITTAPATTTPTNITTTTAASSIAAGVIRRPNVLASTFSSRHKTATANMPTSSPVVSSCNSAYIPLVKVQLTQSSCGNNRSRSNISKPRSTTRKINYNEMSSNYNNNRSKSNNSSSGYSFNNSMCSRAVCERILTPARDNIRCNGEEASSSCQTAWHVAAVR